VILYKDDEDRKIFVSTFPYVLSARLLLKMVGSQEHVRVFVITPNHFCER
jgi:hypothetical protein